MSHASLAVVVCLLLAASPARALTLARDSQPRCAVTHRGSSAPILFAAAELEKYIKQITGADSLPADAPITITVARRADLSDAQRALLPPPPTGHDGYSIVVTDDAILLAADSDIAAAYAAYDLLERLGCRFFYPQQDKFDREVVPHAPTLELAPARWSVASPFRFRICNGDAFFFDIRKEPALAQLDHALKTRHNMIGWQQGGTPDTIEQQYRRLDADGILPAIARRGMSLHGPAHSFDRFLRWEDYGDKHPEYFGLRNGKRVPQNFFGAQFCWSNAEARKAFADNVARFADAAPLITILCIVPFDGGIACACDECKKQGGPSNLLMLVMSEVIDRLAKSRPDLLVETVGGYGPVTAPPAEAKIHPKQRIIWAHWGRYLAEGYDHPKYDRRNLEAWHAAAPAGFTVCNYYSDNFAEPWVMPPWTRAIERDRRYLIANNIDSVYFLIWPPGYWWNHSLNTYLAGRCHYDPALAPDDLLRDYALHYYGPAGEKLAAYYSAWAADPAFAYRVRDDATDADRQTLANQQRDLINPALELVKHDPLNAHRLAKPAALHRLAQRLADFHRLRQQYKAARAAGDIAKSAALLEQADYHADALMGLFHDLAERDQGLIDKNEVSGFIKLAIKNWIAEERKTLQSHPTPEP